MKDKIYIKGHHGESYTRIFSKWNSMLSRCSPKWKHRRIYFDKGISVCEEWKVYLNFKTWCLNNGYEENLELDRIDNDKGYSPDNCRFVTKLVNNCNKSNTIYIEYNGEKVSAKLLLLQLSIPEKDHPNIVRRIGYGWTLEDSINKPKRHYIKT